MSWPNTRKPTCAIRFVFICSVLTHSVAHWLVPTVSKVEYGAGTFHQPPFRLRVTDTSVHQTGPAEWAARIAQSLPGNAVLQ